MLLNGIGFLILLFSLKDFKRGFMFYLVYQIFWYPGALLFDIGFSIIISMALNILFFILYLTRKHKQRHIRMPYTFPILAIIFSLFITCFTAVAGFSSEFSRMISNICQEYLVIWITWDIIEDKEDFNFLFRMITFVILAACLYELLEYILQTNFLLDYKSTLSKEGIVQYKNTLYEARTRGYRASSFFEHPIGAGMNLGMYFVIVHTVLIYYKTKLPLKWLAIFTSILCILGIIFTKMRAGLVFVAIASISLIDFKKKWFYELTLLFFIGILLIFPIIQNNLYILLSLFSESARVTAGGSSISMRLSQLEAITQLMMLSPIGGLGEKFGSYISNQYTIAALSYESIWFEQMARHGILGVIANIILAYYSIIKLPKKYKSKPAFFLSLAYWITYTLTTIPSFRTPLYFVLLFYYIKSSNIYQKNRYKKEIYVKVGI